MSRHAYTYPSSYETWFEYNEINVRSLFRCLDELNKNKPSEYSQKRIANLIGKSETQFTRLKGDQNWQKLDRKSYTDIITYLYTKNFLLGIEKSNVENPYAIYQGLSSFLGMTSDDVDLAKKCLSGAYIAFRLSSYLGGKFVLKGYMIVTPSEDSNVIKTFERFHVTRGVAEQEKNYIREGYLFLRNKLPIIISRNIQSDDLQLIIMQNVSLRPSHAYERPVENMDGAIFHTQDNEIYSTRIALVRSNKTEFEDGDLCVLDLSEIKADFANALQRGIDNVGGYVFRFT